MYYLLSFPSMCPIYVFLYTSTILAYMHLYNIYALFISLYFTILFGVFDLFFLLLTVAFPTQPSPFHYLEGLAIARPFTHPCPVMIYIIFCLPLVWCVLTSTTYPFYPTTFRRHSMTDIDSDIVCVLV